MKSKWSLVPQAVSQTSVSIWVGSLFEDNFKPDLSRVELIDADSEQLIHSKEIYFGDWRYPFSAFKKRFYQTLEFDQLSAQTRYKVKLIRCEQLIYDKPSPERLLSHGEFTTLPNELNVDTPWVIATGSCFYNEEDEGFAAKAYMALAKHPDEHLRPQCKFFTGDQVYLDIGIDSLTRNAREVPHRIANDYALTWQQQRQMYRTGANWFLADDHEYWNNFPCLSGTNPYLWMIMGSDRVKRAWQKAAKDGVRNIQQITPVKTFEIGNELSFCIADFRSDRKADGRSMKLMNKVDFKKVLTWAKQLSCPGVLVSPQPLLVEPGDDDMDLSLANFNQDYQQLLQALASTGQDIVVLSGDVHFGRIAEVNNFGSNGGRLFEVISSPLSNLTGLDGKIAAEAPQRLETFPAIEVPQIPAVEVNYSEPWSVSTKSAGCWPLDYTKTNEHFMTLAFSKDQQNIQLNIKAWLVNEQDETGLPALDFSRTIELKRLD